MTSTKHVDFSLRPPTLDDLPAVVELLNLCALGTTGTPSATVEQMRTNWEHPGFDMSMDVCLAEDGAQVVGL